MSYDSAIIVAIVCLSALSTVLLVSVIYVILKLAKKDKKIIADNLGSDSNFKVSGNVVWFRNSLLWIFSQIMIILIKL